MRQPVDGVYFVYGTYWRVAARCGTFNSLHNVLVDHRRSTPVDVDQPVATLSFAVRRLPASPPDRFGTFFLIIFIYSTFMPTIWGVFFYLFQCDDSHFCWLHLPKNRWHEHSGCFRSLKHSGVAVDPMKLIAKHESIESRLGIRQMQQPQRLHHHQPAIGSWLLSDWHHKTKKWGFNIPI